MKKALVLLIFPVILLLGCKDESTPPEELPPGYQQDIIWPSLADSPWPIYHADPQNTGRSKFNGPVSGKIITTISAKSMQSIPVLDNNNTLFFETADPTALYCVKNYSELLWKKDIGGSDYTSPIVDSENNVYFLTSSELLKYNAQGDLIWSYSLPVFGTFSAALTIDKFGNIYFISWDKKLTVISKSGNLVYEIPIPQIAIMPTHVPAFSPDGSIIYLQGETVSLIAVDIVNKTIEWTFGNKPCYSAPIVDSEGYIYIIPSDKGKDTITLYSLDKFGKTRWEAIISSKYGRTSEEPAIDKWGNIIIGHEDTLLSLNNFGELNWKKSVSPFSVLTSLIVDNSGNIYLGAQYQTSFKEMCFNKDGNLLWETLLPNAIYPPILNSDGKLIVPNFKGESIYIIGD